jgi:hypothetical protein
MSYRVRKNGIDRGGVSIYKLSKLIVSGIAMSKLSRTAWTYTTDGADVVRPIASGAAATKVLGDVTGDLDRF